MFTPDDIKREGYEKKYSHFINEVKDLLVNAVAQNRKYCTIVCPDNESRNFIHKKLIEYGFDSRIESYSTINVNLTKLFNS